MSKIARITFKVLDLLVVFVMTFSSPMSALAQVSGTELSTDKSDYAPGEAAHITGAGFTAGDYILAVNGPDGAQDWGTVTADGAGGFTSDSPAFASEGTYEVQALAVSDGASAASVTFTVTAPPPATAEPTSEPTAEPTAEPTQEPTSEPTAEPTPAPIPTIQSDKDDYAPGELVTLSGGNWQGDTQVRIFVNDDLGQTWSRDVVVNVEPEGTILDSFNLPTWFVATYIVSASGQQTGRVVTTIFTDSAGSYNISWTAADAKVNNAPFLPTYTKLAPSVLTCPTPSGGTGRASDPLANAVFGNPRDSVTSLAPQDMALGQVVPFEVEIRVSSSTAPENGVIRLTSGWNTHSTPGDDFGFDPAYMVYCAFVDSADAASVDPGNNAKVDLWSSTLANPGGGSTEEIQGTIQVSGLNNGDRIILEIWTVLKSSIPAGSSGNVQTRLISAQTVLGDTINTGNQTVPLRNIQQFFSSNADVSVIKTDTPDPVVAGQSLTYTLSVTNNSATTIANGVVVTDTLDPNTTFLSGTWPSGTCTHTSGVVTCNIGALIQGQTVSVTIVTQVSFTAPTAGTVQTGTCTVGQAGVDLCNRVSVTAITADPNSANNSDSEPTNVLASAPHISLTKSADPTTYSSVGQVITYTLVATNDGSVPLTNVSISDPLLGTLSCSPTQPATLAVGATLTCTGSYTITQTDLNGGSVSNTATAIGTYGPTNVTAMASATVTGAAAPALSLVKTATPATYSTVGEIINYSYVVTNSGNVRLAGPVTVSDDKATVTCPSVNTVGDLDGFLDPGESITCTASYTITQADLDSGSVTNTATASAGGTDSNQDSETVTAVQSPALTLDKTVAETSYDSVDDTLSYSYLVTNAGNVRLAGPVTVTDDKAAVVCPNVDAVGNLDEFLDPGEAVTCTATYTITQDDLDAGSVTNIATAHANGTDSNTDTETVNADQSPELTLVKSATPVTYDAVGDLIGYSYVITNTGNISLAGPVTVTDDKAAVSCPNVNTVGDLDGFLDPGESVTCSASYIITQSDLNSGSVTNTATAHADGTDSNTDTETVTASQSPAIDLEKSVTSSGPYDSVGDAITYELVATNTGNVTLSDVSISDPMLDTLTCTPVQPATLAPNATLTCTGSYTVAQSDLDAGTVDNTATATGSFNDNEYTDTDSESVPTTQSASLTLDKTVAESTYDSVGDVLTYSYKLTNSGNVTLSAPYSVDDDKTTVTCPAIPSSLVPGAFVTCSATYSVTQADLDAGSVTNTAMGNAFFDATEIDSNEDSTTVNATQTPSLIVNKALMDNADEDGSDTVSLNDTLTYTITATNNGNVTLHNVVVSDSLTGDSTTCASVAPAGICVLTVTYIVSQADVDAGNIHNIGTADSDETGPTEDPNDVPVAQTPALTLVKTATPGTYSSVSDVISYSYELTNTGNVTLSGPFTVSDDKATVTCPATSSLAPNASITCTASYSITQADLDTGTVTNTAQGKGSFNGNDVLSNEDAETVTAVQSPAIELVKSVTSTGPYDSVGDMISYELVATNTGNVTLSNVSISDPLLGPLTCIQPVTLAPDATLTCTGSYTITQSDLDAGQVDNTATTTGSFEGEDYTDTDSESVPMTQNPVLSLEKTGTFDAGADGIADPGETITYTFVVSNDGNVTLHHVTVTDPLAGLSTISCNSTTILVGELITCIATYQVTQADVDAGFVYNLATADSDESGPDDDDNNEPLPQDPKLSLSKTGTFDAGADGFADVGELITYTFVVTNTGNVTLHNVSIVDPQVPTITCLTGNPIPSLAVGASETCTGTYAVTQADIDTGSVYNLATADSDESGPDEDDNTEALPQSPVIHVVKSSTTTSITHAGQVVPYTFVVTNTGNVTLTGITVSDPMCDAPPTYVSGDTNNDGKLQVDETWTYTCNHTVTQAEIDTYGPSTNLALGANPLASDPGWGGGSYPWNITDGQTYYTDTWAHGLAFTGGSGSYMGQACGYRQATVDLGAPKQFTRVLVWHHGDDHVPTNYGVDYWNGTQWLPVGGSSSVRTDLQTTTGWGSVPTETIFSAVTGSKVRFWMNNCDIVHGWIYEFQVFDANGELLNTVTADSTESDEDTDNHSIPISYNPALSLDKAGTFDAGLDGLADPGELITYTFIVTNTGNVTLHNVTVTDPLTGLSTITCDATTVPVGGSITCTATYAVTQADIDAGSVYNLATADSDESRSDTDDETVSLPQNHALTVNKTADPVSMPEPGGAVTFTVRVNNTGNTTLNLTTLDDNVYGDIADSLNPNIPGTSCSVPQTISVDGSYECSFTANVTGEPGLYTDTVTAMANEVSASDDATVELTDVGPSISVEKSANPTSLPEPGGNVTFTVVVTNNSFELVTLTSLSDDVYGNLNGQGSCATSGSIDPGDSYTCSFVGAVTGEPGLYTDIVTAVATDNDGSTDDASDSATVELTDVAPTVDLNKSVDDNEKPEPGGIFTFTLTITNTSVEMVTITGLGDSNVLSPTGTPECLALVNTTLALGQSVSCSYTITHTDAGSYPNTAEVTVADNEGNPAGDTDSETVTVTDVKPTVTLTKTADPATLSEPGGDFEFTITITNTSVEPVTITDIDDTQTMACDHLIGEILAVNEVFTCTYTITHTDAGSYPNNASVTVTDNEDNEASDSDDEIVTVTNINPTVTLTKTADPTTLPEPGGDFEFTIVITNTSVEPVTVTAFDDTQTSACDYLIGEVLAVGESTTCTYIITHTDAGSYSNTASVTVADNEGNEASDSDDETVTITNVNPTVTLTKTADPTTLPEPGGDFEFTVVITNTSVEPVTITAFDDTQTAACDYLIGEVLAVGGSVTCIYTVTHTDADSYPNTASVTVEDNEGNEASASDNETVTVTDVLPTVDLTKTADPITLPEPGGVFTFTLTITNTSVENVEITGLGDSNVLSPENTPECLALVGTTLTPGQSVSCEYDITHTDAGSYDNTAEVTVADNEGNPAGDTDSETVTVTDVKPAISVTKTASPSSVPETGASVTFTFVVTNNSVEPVTITSLSDSDFGTLAGDADCSVSTILGVGDSCTFTEAHFIGGDFESGIDHVNTFTAHAEDNENNDASDDDDATVAFTNSIAQIDVEKFVSVDGGTTWLDADSATGPFVVLGQSVMFKFVVANMGNTTLSNVSLTDSDFDLSACMVPTTLAAGGSFECTITTTAASGQHSDTATAAGSFTDGAGNEESDSDTDDAHYFGADPQISINKVTVDASTEGDALNVLIGESISWKYTVSNAGNVPLSSITVTDDQGVTVTCPKTTLAVGESMDCTASGTATTGTYTNTGTTTGSFTDDNGYTQSDTASDGSSYFGADPQIAVTKVTVDGPTSGDGLNILTGESIIWRYTVTNAGNVPLSTVTVIDNKPGVTPAYVSGDANSNSKLDLTETWIFEASGTATTGNYTNTGTASGKFTDTAGHVRTDTATDTSSYFGANPQIDIIKKTVGSDGTEGDNVFVLINGAVTWKYYVTNTGNVALSNVTVTDNKPGATVTCPKTTLAVGESMTCTANGTNTTPIGTWYSNIGTATGSYTDSASHSRTAADTDASSYYSQNPGVVTNSSLCDFGASFRLIFTPDVKNYTSTNPAYKLSDSNPGQYFYNVFQTGGTGTVTLTLPYPFVTQGATPIHVYRSLTAAQVNGQTCLQPTNEIKNYQQIVTLNTYGSSPNYPGRTTTLTLTGLPTTGFMYINIHMDYGLEKLNGWVKSGANANYNLTINPTMPKVNIGNNTQHTFTSSIPNSTDSIFNTNEFKKVKGFGGMVTIRTGVVNNVNVYEGLMNAKIELRNSTGKLIETMYTDVNGWYLSTFIPPGKSATYTLKLISNTGNVEGVTYVYTGWTQSVTTGGANKFAEGPFQINP